jgi:hypothetical protein
MLAVPPGTGETLYERTGYVGALQEANSGTYGPWEGSRQWGRKLAPCAERRPRLPRER